MGGVCGYRVIGADVSDMFFEARVYCTSRLSDIGQVTGVTFKLVYAAWIGEGLLFIKLLSYSVMGSESYL
jgi:hypothetical protein